MKICKYCNTTMISDYETDRRNAHKYKGFHTCPNCRAVCEETVTDNKSERITHEEKWWNPSTNECE